MAFYNNTYLIFPPRTPDSIRIIDRCYANCSNLKNSDVEGEEYVIIPDGVNNIDYLFSNCSNYIIKHSLTIPNSVLSMEKTFEKCNIESLPQLPEYLENMYGCFSSATFSDRIIKFKQTAKMEIPNSVTNMSWAFSKSNIQISPTIPEGVLSLSGCFSNCFNLYEIKNIPSTVEDISFFFSIKNKYENDSPAYNIPFVRDWNLTDPSKITSFVHAFDFDYSSVSYKETWTDFTIILYFGAKNETVKSNIELFLENYTTDAKNTYGIPTNPRWDIGMVVYPPTEAKGFTEVPYTKLSDTLKIWKKAKDRVYSSRIEPINYTKIWLTEIPSSALNERDENDVPELAYKLRGYSSRFIINRNSWAENGENYNFKNALRGESNNPVYLSIFQFPDNSFGDFSYCFYYANFDITDVNNIPKFPEGAENLSFAFSDCSFNDSKKNIDLSTYKLPSTVKNISDMFSDINYISHRPQINHCLQLENIGGFYRYDTTLTEYPKIPQSVKIMNNTFSGCSNLEEPITLHEGITNLNYCFSYCSKLTDIPVIPQSVTSLEGAFMGCTNLVHVSYVPRGKSNYRLMFSNCFNLETIEDWQLTPEESALLDNYNSYYYIFSGCSKLKEVKVDKPYTSTEQNKWQALLVKTNQEENTADVKIFDTDNKEVLSKTVSLNALNIAKIEGYVDEFVHADSGMITNDTISKLLIYRKPFSSDDKSLDPSQPNFVLWAKDPTKVVSNILGGGGGGTTVKPNPELKGDEEELTSIQIGTEKFAIGIDNLRDIIVKNSGPIGELKHFPEKKYQYGYMFADGRIFLPDIYPEFFEYWKQHFETECGYDSNGYPRLPDYRNMFIRGNDGTRGAYEKQRDSVPNLKGFLFGGTNGNDEILFRYKSRAYFEKTPGGVYTIYQDERDFDANRYSKTYGRRNEVAPANVSQYIYIKVI